MAEVLVDDTGIGFAAEVTERLYEPFFTTKPQGMGMGLAISRTIVEMHRGRLSVEPRASGLGTTVRLVLPLVPSQKRARDRHDGSPTVFVVDDNPGVRKSLQALVEAEGLAVATYASAAEFLEAWDAQRPGCLVLDVRLRGDSGLDLQDELRKRNATLPIIVMTGYADVPTSVRALKGGAIDFLRKPVPPKQLVARIREAIEVDRRTRDAASAARRRHGPHRAAHAARAPGDGAAGRGEQLQGDRGGAARSACARWRAIAAPCSESWGSPRRRSWRAPSRGTSCRRRTAYVGTAGGRRDRIAPPVQAAPSRATAAKMASVSLRGGRPLARLSPRSLGSQ